MGHGRGTGSCQKKGIRHQQTVPEGVYGKPSLSGLGLAHGYSSGHVKEDLSSPNWD